MIIFYLSIQHTLTTTAMNQKTSIKPTHCSHYNEDTTPEERPRINTKDIGSNYQKCKKFYSQMSTYFMKAMWDIGARGLSVCVEGRWRV
jgi:hypothetical protein